MVFVPCWKGWWGAGLRTHLCVVCTFHCLFCGKYATHFAPRVATPALATLVSTWVIDLTCNGAPLQVAWTGWCVCGICGKTSQHRAPGEGRCIPGVDLRGPLTPENWIWFPLPLCNYFRRHNEVDFRRIEYNKKCQSLQGGARS